MEDLTLTKNMGGEEEEETSVGVEGESVVDKRKDETNIKKEKENYTSSAKTKMFP